MGITITKKKAVEKSTYVVTVSFQDEDGGTVSPDTAMWTLVDDQGGIVNAREQVAIAPAASVDIVLSGNDLAILRDLIEEKRHLVVEATYTSSLGAGLPLNQQLDFSVVNLKYIA